MKVIKVKNLQTSLQLAGNSHKYQTNLIIILCCLFFLVNFILIGPSYIFMNPTFKCLSTGEQIIKQQKACEMITECQIIQYFTLTSKMKLYCEDQGQRIVLQTLFSVGSLIGILCMNTLADTKGRRYSVILSISVALSGVEQIRAFLFFLCLSYCWALVAIRYSCFLLLYWVIFAKIHYDKVELFYQTVHHLYMENLSRTKGIVVFFGGSAVLGVLFLVPAIQHSNMLSSGLIGVSRIFFTIGYTLIICLQTQSFSVQIQSTAAGVIQSISLLGIIIAPTIVSFSMMNEYNPMVVLSLLLLLGIIPIKFINQTNLKAKKQGNKLFVQDKQQEQNSQQLISVHSHN